ncbi:MAG: 23S rRNA (guanosine(2251)-2'-O)-methyltransferase RlmB [Bacteroidales bacterium]|jgi:23S rRNA (guanosine2251-2'-O)-methyltransferase|nr:23S rRNA (guanosine(2251)-2'-O)-methyltransferase RlmB [Bacteroidales bacterium]
MEKIQSKQQIIYGLRPVIEALGSGQQVERVLIQNGLNSSLLNELRTKLKEHDIPFQYVPVEKLNKMTTGNHQGVVATIAAVKYHSFMQLMETLEEPSVVVLLDHVTDVRNMGAIARTAECTGVAALVVPDHGSAAINEDAIKTSSGALLRLPVCREQNLKTVVNLAKQCGYQVVAATEKGAVHYREVDFRKPTLLIMGNEETGISTELLKMSDVRAKLPIVGEVASLNVSVAAGVFMYEALEQRSTR